MQDCSCTEGGYDCAERAVKLAIDFNEVLTKNDRQHQLLYEVVEHHIKLLPSAVTKKQLQNQMETM